MELQSPWMILPIKACWFNMIKACTKLEEYREIKPYYIKRLSNIFMCETEELVELLRNEPREIRVLFRNGYSKTSPSFEADCLLTVKTGNEDWGAVEGIEYLTFTIINII